MYVQLTILAVILFVIYQAVRFVARLADDLFKGPQSVEVKQINDRDRYAEILRKEALIDDLESRSDLTPKQIDLLDRLYDELYDLNN